MRQNDLRCPTISQVSREFYAACPNEALGQRFLPALGNLTGMWAEEAGIPKTPACYRTDCLEVVVANVFTDQPFQLLAVLEFLILDFLP